MLGYSKHLLMCSEYIFLNLSRLYTALLCGNYLLLFDSDAEFFLMTCCMLMAIVTLQYFYVLQITVLHVVQQLD